MAQLSRSALLVVISVFLVSPLPGAFSDPIGGMPGMLLNYAGTPRTIAIGKAFTGLANDVEAGYFNPAGLIQLNAQNVKLSHSQLYADCNYEYLSYGLPTKFYGTFGLTMLGIWSRDIEARTGNNELKTYGWGYFENALLFSYAYELTNWLGIGTNLKLATKNVNYRSGVAAGADLGAIILAPKPFQFGLFAQNLLAPDMVDFPDERYPLTLRAGTAVRFFRDRIAVALDLVKVGLDTLTGLQPHGGLEFEVVPGVLTPRFGLDRNEVSLGVGVKQLWGNFGLGVDYAFLLHHSSAYMLNPTHKIGINIEFGGYRTWIQATPTLFSPTPNDKQNVLLMDIKTISRRPIKRWQVLIRNNLGEIVRTYGTWESPPLRLEWDGLDDAGRLVSDGRYYYQIILVDERNESLEHEGFLTNVRTRGPAGKVDVEPKN